MQGNNRKLQVVPGDAVIGNLKCIIEDEILSEKNHNKDKNSNENPQGKLNTITHMYI
mgnify:CR=1 FL=1|jgi:hypothetical protein